MSTLTAIKNYLNGERLVYVDQSLQLQSASPFNRLARCIKALFIGHEAAYADCKSERVAQAVDRFLNQRNLTAADGWSAINFLRKLRNRVRKPENQNRLQIVADRAAHRVLAPKREFVNQAIQYMESNPQSSIAYRDALAFLQQGRDRIVRGEQTPLPLWFHATKNEEEVRSILQCRTIFQNYAVRGYGAYVSSSDEAGQIIGYGRYTFALDDEYIQDKQGAYFVPNPENSIGN